MQPLCKSKSMGLFIGLQTSVLMQLAANSNTLCVKQIAYESKYVDTELPALLVSTFLQEWTRLNQKTTDTAELRAGGLEGIIAGRTAGLTDFL